MVTFKGLEGEGVPAEGRETGREEHGEAFRLQHSAKPKTLNKFSHCFPAEFCGFRPMQLFVTLVMRGHSQTKD